MNKQYLKDLGKWIIENEDGIEVPEYIANMGGILIIAIPVILAVAAAVSALWTKTKGKLDTI